jgi:deoxyhypusine synthase
MGSISEFIERHFRHFNAAVLKDAADAYIAHLDRGGKMMITLAGAMSTAELGVSLAEMIRRDKVHAITCTGANMEEDLFNLVARSKYERIPNYRELSPQQEKQLLQRHLNRVTDTCIPEEEAMRRIERVVLDEWAGASQNNQRNFPHEFLYKILRECRLKQLDGRCCQQRPAIVRAGLGRFDLGKYLRGALHHRGDRQCAGGPLGH